LLSDDVNVPFTVVAERRDTLEMKPSFTIQIVKRISLAELKEARVEEEVMDSIIIANCKKKQNIYEINGKLLNIS